MNGIVKVKEVEIDGIMYKIEKIEKPQVGDLVVTAGDFKLDVSTMTIKITAWTVAERWGNDKGINKEGNTWEGFFDDECFVLIKEDVNKSYNAEEEEYNKQHKYIVKLLKQITDEQINMIKKNIKKMSGQSKMHDTDIKYMTQVLDWRSARSFDELETEPRETLWAELNKIEKYTG